MNKLDINKPVQTRDGRPARIIATDVKSSYPIVALVKVCINNNEECENNVSYTKDGKCFASKIEDDPRDLINVPETAYRPWTQAEAANLGVCGCTVRVNIGDSYWTYFRASIIEVGDKYLCFAGCQYSYKEVLDKNEIFLNGQWQRCGIKI